MAWASVRFTRVQIPYCVYGLSASATSRLASEPLQAAMRLRCRWLLAKRAGHMPLSDLVWVPSSYSAPAPLQAARWHGTHLLFTRMQVIRGFAEGAPSFK